MWLGRADPFGAAGVLSGTGRDPCHELPPRGFIGTGIGMSIDDGREDFDGEGFCMWAISCCDRSPWLRSTSGVCCRVVETSRGRRKGWAMFLSVGWSMFVCNVAGLSGRWRFKPGWPASNVAKGADDCCCGKAGWGNVVPGILTSWISEKRSGVTGGMLDGYQLACVCVAGGAR